MASISQSASSASTSGQGARGLGAPEVVVGVDGPGGVRSPQVGRGVQDVRVVDEGPGVAEAAGADMPLFEVPRDDRVVVRQADGIRSRNATSAAISAAADGFRPGTG